jgi:hypothetical protein
MFFVSSIIYSIPDICCSYHLYPFDLGARQKKKVEHPVVSRGGLSGPWIEEAGFQDYEKLSLGERGCWGSEVSWKEPSSSYKDLRILV